MTTRLLPAVGLVALASVSIQAPLAAPAPALPPMPPAACTTPDDQRIAVMLVGSYHMSNPGADMFNLESDDVLSDERQAEIRALVDRLAAFRPTKVAVEAPWQDTATVGRWDAYLAGARELRRSEEEQIGFRLAKQVGIRRIHPIDVRVGLDMQAVGQVVQAAPRFGRNMQQLDSLGRWAVEYMAGVLQRSTIGEMLHTMNRPEAIELAHVPYIAYLAPIAHEDDYAGADMVADWCKRNLRIFANLTRIAEPGDRVFVIFGQSHIKTLKDFVTQHPDYCVMDPLPFLE